MTKPTISIGGLLHETDRLIKKRFDRFADTTGMSRAQWYVLARVAKRQGINQATLADISGVEPITICRMVDRLEALGLVERRPDHEDRRARLIHTTEAAKPGIERMHAAAMEVFGEALNGFSASEIDTLTGLLGRLYHNLLVSVGEESPFDTSKINRLGPETEA